jgi:hypothetical protein
VAVCGSVLGSVWQCARQCAAVRQCAVVRVWQCGSVWQCARLSATVCAAVCGSVWQCTQQCTTVMRSKYTQSHSQYVLVYPYRAGENEPYIPHILIRTSADQHTY